MREGHLAELATRRAAARAEEAKAADAAARRSDEQGGEPAEPTPAHGVEGASSTARPPPG